MKIAILGEMRSGKDTVGEFLQENYNMHRFGFADELKKEFHKQFPHIPRDPKPIRGYQLFGQLCRDVYGEDYWVDKLFEKMRFIDTVASAYNIKNSQPGFSPVITDVRQPNEVQRCKDEGFVLVRLNSPQEIRIDRINKLKDNFSVDVLSFETETGIKNYKVDYDIDNDGTLEDLYKKVEDVIRQVRDS